MPPTVLAALTFRLTAEDALMAFALNALAVTLNVESEVLKPALAKKVVVDVPELRLKDLGDVTESMAPVMSKGLPKLPEPRVDNEVVFCTLKLPV
jgi:hypothetical protein